MQNKIHNAPKVARRKQNAQALSDISQFLENRRNELKFKERNALASLRAAEGLLKKLKAERAEFNRLCDNFRLATQKAVKK